MIVRYSLAALVAGMFAGALQTVVQQAKVVPLIRSREYEEGDPVHHQTTGLPFPDPRPKPRRQATAKICDSRACGGGRGGRTPFGVTGPSGTLAPCHRRGLRAAVDGCRRLHGSLAYACQRRALGFGGLAQASTCFRPSASARTPRLSGRRTLLTVRLWARHAVATAVALHLVANRRSRWRRPLVSS